jgi:hypothetical protein
LDDAEDGGVRCDPERQGDLPRRGKSRASLQHAHRVPQIAPQNLDRGERLEGSPVLLQERGVAELPSRDPTAFSCDMPCATNLSASNRRLSLDLVVELAVMLLTAQKTAQLRRENA